MADDKQKFYKFKIENHETVQTLHIMTPFSTTVHAINKEDLQDLMKLINIHLLQNENNDEKSV